MNYILFDDASWDTMLPLTFTKPVSELRVGIFTIKEKWQHRINNDISYLTKSYLQDKYPLIIKNDNVLINSSILPEMNFIHEIYELGLNEALYSGDHLLACRLDNEGVKGFLNKDDLHLTPKEFVGQIFRLTHPYHIFSMNGEAIEMDFEFITRGRKSEPISSTNNVLEKGRIFIEKGARVEFATLNASKGPIYIGKDAEIMEGCLVRGPFAMGEKAVLKMGAKIYGPTTLGPHCKVGGEVSNSVFIGYANKGHDGYLGNSVIGEWCNLGADTNSSNLKNNYAEVKLWNYVSERFDKTGLQFCGLIMGDHSKCAINTMFNTGTVIGVSTNIYGEGFPRNFVPSFSWGGASGFKEYNYKKATEVAEIVYGRRNKVLDDKEKKILKHIFDSTEKYRGY